MKIAELRKLPEGSLVVWIEARMSLLMLPKAPKGRVRVAERSASSKWGRRTPERWIEWEDGQRTEDFDDLALEHVEYVEEVK